MNTPKNCGNAPKAIELEKGKNYAWCSCGLAPEQPFCDGSHKGSEMRSKVFSPDTDGTHYMCMCKQTKNPPYCDGSHNNA